MKKSRTPTISPTLRSESPHVLWACALVLLMFARPAISRQSSPGQEPPAAGTPLSISLQEALERARANSQQLQTAVLNTSMAREDRAQAKAGLLPTLSSNNQMIYTQGNGTPSGVFVSNDGVHLYNSQANVHQDLLSAARVLEYRRTVMAQAIAEAKAEVLARGLTAAVVQNYYALVIAQRRSINAQQSHREARQLVDTTEKLEKGGEVARADVIKTRIVLQQRSRDLQDARLGIEKARISLAVLLFPDLRLDFDVRDDLKATVPLAPFDEIRTQAMGKSPEMKAAELTLRDELLGIRAARSAYLPTLSFDFWYGINSNQYSVYTGDTRNLGYAAQASLNIPLWNWGATRSKVRQAEIRQRQAQMDLTLARKQLLSEINSLYAEARSTQAQLDSLRSSVDLSAESLRLTILRYQAGEVSVLEVVDAQSTATQARNEYDDGLSRYRVALANLQTLTGTL